LKQVISSKQGALEEATQQLVEWQHREQEVRTERDSLQHQVLEVAERLQKQVMAKYRMNCIMNASRCGPFSHVFVLSLSRFK
jgi:hypothetical protein